MALDANLLVLFVVGATCEDYISRHKRCRDFSRADYALLYEMLSRYKRVVVTPNVLTETSNLLAHAVSPAREEIFAVFRALIHRFEEVAVPGRIAANRPEFSRLGLSDSVLVELADTETVLLTNDTELYIAALAAKKLAVHFSFLRDADPWAKR